jgi:hypothetical protein
MPENVMGSSNSVYQLGECEKGKTDIIQIKRDLI